VHSHQAEGHGAYGFWLLIVVLSVMWWTIGFSAGFGRGKRAADRWWEGEAHVREMKAYNKGRADVVFPTIHWDQRNQTLASECDGFFVFSKSGSVTLDKRGDIAIQFEPCPIKSPVSSPVLHLDSSPSFSHNPGKWFMVCGGALTLIIDEWPNGRNLTCIPTPQALKFLQKGSTLTDGDTVTLTHKSPRPEGITDDMPAFPLCVTPTHCWDRNPDGTLGDERSWSKPEPEPQKRHGADGTVTAVIGKT
jgi:hypothetical protein